MGLSVRVMLRDTEGDLVADLSSLGDCVGVKEVEPLISSVRDMLFVSSLLTVSDVADVSELLVVKVGVSETVSLGDRLMVSVSVGVADSLLEICSEIVGETVNDSDADRDSVTSMDNVCEGIKVADVDDVGVFVVDVVLLLVRLVVSDILWLGVTLAVGAEVTELDKVGSDEGDADPVGSIDVLLVSVVLSEEVMFGVAVGVWVTLRDDVCDILTGVESVDEGDADAVGATLMDAVDVTEKERVSCTELVTDEVGEDETVGD